MTSSPDRRKILELVNEAEQAGARRSAIARHLGLSRRTLDRWRDESGRIREDARKSARRPEPANKLSETERHKVLQVCNRAEYSHLPPSQIVTKAG